MLTLAALVISVLVGAFVLQVSVAMVGGDKVADKNDCGTAIGVVLAVNLLGLLLGWIPLLGFPLWVLAWFVIVMGAYDIGFVRALLVAIVQMVISIVIQLILVAALGLTAFGALAMLRAFGIG